MVLQLVCHQFIFIIEKVPPISNLNNVNVYNPDYNSVKRYSSKQAPSNGSLTEAFFKSQNYI